LAAPHPYGMYGAKPWQVTIGAATYTQASTTFPACIVTLLGHKMYQMIGAIDLLLGVMCGILATLMIVSNPSGGVFLNAMAFVVALSGVGLSSVGLYLVSK
jgi:hypothetical protein